MSRSKKTKTLLDTLLPKKQKPSHKKRNAAVIIAVGSALITGLTKTKKPQS